MSNASKTTVETYTCDFCHESRCSNCAKPANFWKWKLCPSCSKYKLQALDLKKAQVKNKRNQRRISNRFKLRLKNSIAFKALVNYLAKEFEEVPFLKTTKALVAKAMDPSRICLAEVKIPKSYFNEYGANNALVALDNMDLLNNAIQAILEGENILITGDKKNVQIELTDGTLKFNRSELELEDIDIPVENLKTISYDAKLTILSQDLLNALNLATLNQSSIVRLNATPERDIVEIIASTLELTAQKAIQGRNSAIKKEAKSTYDANFLKRFIQFLTPLNLSLNLEFSTEKPLHLSSIIDTNILIDYWLAPRVDEEKDKDF